jgi:hypothetical protein
VNGWSTTEVVGILVWMAVTLAAAYFRRPLARALVNTNPAYAHPPISPLHDDSPEETRAKRDAGEQVAKWMSVWIVLAAALTWVFGILALIDGREGPILDALL